MQTTQSSLTAALELLPTRDLRFYGVYTHSFTDSLAICEQVNATPFDAAQNDALVALYAQVLPTLPEFEQGDILHKLKRCPRRPEAA